MVTVVNYIRSVCHLTLCHIDVLSRLEFTSIVLAYSFFDLTNGEQINHKEAQAHMQVFFFFSKHLTL